MSIVVNEKNSEVLGCIAGQVLYKKDSSGRYVLEIDNEQREITEKQAAEFLERLEKRGS